MQQICIEHFANHHAKLYLYHVSVIYSAKLVEKEWEEYYWEIVKRVETKQRKWKKTFCGRRKQGDGNIAQRAAGGEEETKEEATVGPGGRLMEVGTRY